MKHGVYPVKPKHTDYDFVKSHRLGAATASDAEFSDEYFADSGLTMPNQNAADNEFTPPTPAMPEGCTDFCSGDISTDLDGIVKSPLIIETVTHANALGGIDVHVSLDAAMKLGWFKQYFNIRASGLLDYFDSFRIAQVMGVNSGEKRSISWVTPWFPSWEKALLSGQSIMPMPTSEELNAIRNASLLSNGESIPWHNSKLDGWSNKIPIATGTELYRDKSWQGRNVGDKGFVYFSRDVINMVMTLDGAGAFIPSNTPIASPITVTLSTLQWILSVLRSILARY